MSDVRELEQRVFSLEKQIKKFVALGGIVGMLVGGSGVFGIAQWVYRAPLDKLVVKYESGIGSLQKAIDAANKSGSKDEVKVLRAELIRLDRSYREALGIIDECMRQLSRNRALQQDDTAQWLRESSIELQKLESQRLNLTSD